MIEHGAAGSGRVWWSRAVPRPPEDSTAAFWALMVFTGILLLAPQTYLPVLARIRIALLAGGIAVAAHCWNRMAARQPVAQLTPELGLAGGLALWALVTLPLSEWPGGSLRILLDLYLKALVIFWLLAASAATVRRLRTVAWSLSVMAVPLAATGIGNFLSSQPGGRIAGYDAPLTGNPNDLALMLNLILPLVIALFLAARGRLARAALAAIAALTAVAVIATFSRAGFLVLLTTAVLWLRAALRRGERKWAIAGLVVAAISVPMLPSGYVDRIATMTSIRTDPTGSAQVRWEDMRAALGAAFERPLVGAGLGMNVLALNEIRGPRWQPVHNAYLEYAVDLGWVGLALFLLLLGASIRGAARARDRSAGRPELGDLSILAEGIRISLIGFAVAACFYPVAYHFYFYYFAALAAAAGRAAAAEVP